jgi:lysophospholipase L1-like esterase
MHPVLNHRFALLCLALLAACTSDRVPLTAAKTPLASLDEGRGEFQRYVAIGTSISMGVVSDGVNEGSQSQAWPAQLARLAHRELSLPLIQSPGCGAPLAAPLASGKRINGEGAGQPADTRTCAPNVEGVTLPTNNVAIDGARTRDALFSTTATYGGLRGGEYARVLPPGETQLSAALAQNPKLVSIELGANDIMGARSGIYIPGGTVEVPGGSVERTEVFEALYTRLLDQVQATAKEVLLFGLIDDVMDFPAFRTGQELWDARATFARLWVTVAADCGGANATNVLFVAVRVPDAAARGAARFAAGQTPYELSCANAPSSSGIQDFVLRADEIRELGAQLAAMNAFIAAEADRRGFAYARLGALWSDVNEKGPFDAFALMTSMQPYGPYVSLDGIHPTAAGQAVLAREAARALNARYDLGIPTGDVALMQPAALQTHGPSHASDEDNGRVEWWDGGAFVLNAGEGKNAPSCFYQGGAYITYQATLVRTPSGNWKLSCHFENLPPIAEQESATGWVCSIIGAPADQTHQSSWVRTTSGSANLSCEFSGKPIQDAMVSFGDASGVAQQGNFTLSLDDIPGKSISGETVGVGLGCAPISADLTGKVAVIERGVCAFDVKVRNAMNAGAVAVIVYNSAPFGDQTIIMGGASPVGIPAVFVGRSTGLALLAASPTQVTISYCSRSASCRGIA